MVYKAGDNISIPQKSFLSDVKKLRERILKLKQKIHLLKIRMLETKSKYIEALPDLDDL